MVMTLASKAEVALWGTFVNALPKDRKAAAVVLIAISKGVRRCSSSE